jgi:lipoprotein-anchoring transpeptidase ErfK/SrfK
VKRLLLVLLAVLVLPSAAEAATVKVYFTRGEQLASAKRQAPKGAEGAIRALLGGPTTAERKRGYGTAIPSTVRLLSAKTDDEKVTLTFSHDFATTEDTYLARLAQVVYTLDAAGFEEVTIRGRTFTRDDFGRPESYTAPRLRKPTVTAPKNTRTIQRTLATLGYLPDDAVTGSYDYRTMQAVIAFQAWEGLARDGIAGKITQGRLKTAGRPKPMDDKRGRYVEIYRDRGVVLLAENGRVVRAIHTSTGIGGNSPNLGTPPGKFKIYRKELRSWSVPYKTWLPYAAYWNAGWALHGYADVPAYPASHGCARLPLPEAPFMYDFVDFGTPVRVI